MMSRRIGLTIAIALSLATIGTLDTGAIVRPTLTGDWEGQLQTRVAKLHLVLHVRQELDTLKASLDSPDQMAFGLAIDHIAQHGDSVRFLMKTISAGFMGAFDSTGAELRGLWLQGMATLPLTFTRQSAAKVENRPQDPKPPYPYDTLEVAYENKAGGAHLAGTLTLPRGKGPFTAVLLITGSGPQDRDEEIFGHRPFRVIADHLTRRGIAVLRVDDRGVGQSTGDVSKATSEDFAGDALAGVAFLKTRREIDPKRIGLVGHSEGGLIAPLAAIRSRDVAFIVLMAGPGMRGDRLIPLQGALVARAMGADEISIATGRAINERAFAIATAESDSASIDRGLRALSDSIKATLPEAQRKALGDSPILKDGQIVEFTRPWFRFFLACDPAVALSQVKCPVLAINGERDLQVPPKENLAVIERTLREAGNPDFKTLELPALNHLFQTCKTGSISEYQSIEETIAPIALEAIGDWIVAHTSPRTPGRSKTPDRAPAR